MWLYNFLNGWMEKPVAFGWFHLIFIALVVIAVFVLCKFFRNTSEKVFRRILLGIWITIVVLELLKHFLLGGSVSNGKYEYSYAWYITSFQLCSSPLYIMPFVVFLKDGKVRNACIAFLMTFSLFGGLAAFALPDGIYSEYLYLNIQTMIHHGSQIVVGIYVGARYANRMNVKFFLGGLIVFAIMSAIAILIDELAVFVTDSTVNMFFISRHFPCTLPIIGFLYDASPNPVVPYPVFLAIYILGFAIIAVIFFAVQYLFDVVLFKNEKAN